MKAGVVVGQASVFRVAQVRCRNAGRADCVGDRANASHFHRSELTCLLAGAVVLLLSGSACANTLVHLNKMVWGCIDAQASSELNDEANLRRHDPVWVARTVAKGRCVTISPKSVWEPASDNRNGVTYIDRRGTVQPESYWVPTSAITFPATPAPDSRAPSATSNSAAPAQVQSQFTGSSTSAARDAPAVPASAPPPGGPSAPLLKQPAPGANARQSQVGWELGLTAIVALIVGALLVRRSSSQEKCSGRDDSSQGLADSAQA